MRYKQNKVLRNHSDKKEVEHFSKKKWKKPINKTNSGKPISPLAYRYYLLKDEATGWGGDNINPLMGAYRRQHDGTYCLEDIRKTDLTRLLKYPKTTFHVGPLPLPHPIEGLEDGQYCLFHWKFTFKNKVNPCEIQVDDTKPIVFVNPKDFVQALMNTKEQPAEPEKPIEKQNDVIVLIYDLLHEADKYCAHTVDAQFYLTDKYMSFQHTGRMLTAENILYLCGYAINAYEDHEHIAYHCRGMREFLLANDHTIIISNGYTVRFDNVNGVLKPVWLEKEDLPREIKISLARNKRFTETIVLPFDGEEKTIQNNYKVGLQCVFDEVQNIAFFSNIGKVCIKVKGGKAKTLDRKDWVVSREYKAFVPKDKRPRDFDKKETAIMFACERKDNVLIGEEESPVYSLIPTASSFGFPFLMQLDVHINKTNYTINHRDAWNKTYAEIAGRLFAKWITDMTLKAEYTPESIYAIVPKFDDCIAMHPEEQTFIKLFQKGFKEIILRETEDNKDNTDNYNNKENKDNYSNKENKDNYNNYNKKDNKENNNNYSNSNGRVYVIDTNIFVNCPTIISKMDKDDTVILSAKVVDELDNLKYKLEDKDLRNVQKALKSINLSIDKPNVRMEMSDISLLPRDFDRHNPDNNILSVVLRHKSESPTLLTSDNGLQIKAKGIGINVIGLKEFLASKRAKA